MPTSFTHSATLAGDSSTLMPSVSATSAEPQSDDTERLPCLATRIPAPATTKAVAVDTLKVPEASPPVPQVSISISRSVPVCATTSAPRVRTFTTFWRITCAKPISSSTVSPFIRSAVRKPAICALVAPPDMMASIAAAASIRVKLPRSTRVRKASVMIGLVNTGASLQLPQELLGDDHALDLVRALVDLGDLRVAHEALHRELPCVAVPAEDLHGVCRHLHRRVRRQALGDRR